jgi:CTP synthase
MHPEDIISNPDLESVYEIPLVLYKQGLEKRIFTKLGLPQKTPQMTSWEKMVENIKTQKKNKVEIAIIGKYFGTGEYQLRDSYAALLDAIEHASWGADVEVATRWVDAEKVEKEGPKTTIGNPDGIIVPIGWGERGSEGMIQAVEYSLDKKIPYLGLCYGMQLAVVGFARKELKWQDANTTENDEKTKHPVIHMIENQKELMDRRAYGGTMRLGAWDANVKKGTRAYEIYENAKKFIKGKDGLTSERHRHRSEFNNEYAKDLEKAGLIISARSVFENLVEIIELPEKVHPFFIATQGHPEYKSRPQSPHPLFVAFLEAAK